jgi:hypothetical protein
MIARMRFANAVATFLPIALFMLLGLATATSAQTTIFVPPNDPTGSIFSINGNDGWSGSRGIVFQVGTTRTISSIGLYQDLTGITVNYEIDQTTSASGDLAPGKSILRSGSGTFTTTGLQFITFPIAPLTLTAGNFYQIRFDFSGNSNQNFFYNNGNVIFSQAGFNLIDGTAGDNTGNSVMPRIEISSPVIAAPVANIPTISPIALALLGMLLAGSAFALLRRRG